MKRNVFLILGIVVLSALDSNVFADTIDVVHLKNGSIIKGIVIETIPNETIKIETADGSIFVYPIDEVERMVKAEVVDKKPRTKVKLKSRSTATLLAMGTGLFNLSGSGQLYNGEYIKGLGFFTTQFCAAFLSVNSDRDFTGWKALMYFFYGFSIYDANVSAKKINQQRMDAVSTSLRYIPNQGLVASYNIRF